MTAHDDIVAALLSVLEDEGEIRLIGRLHDDVLANPSDREAFVFIPDLHLLTADRQQRFGSYGFNHSDEGLLASLLAALAALRQQWRRDGDHKLVTVQLGDFFDIWRQYPRKVGREPLPDDAHGELRDLLYRGTWRRTPCLHATMLLGNHDTKWGIPLNGNEIPLDLRAFSRSDLGPPFLFATHGDAFSIIERLVPEELRAFAVNLVGGHTPVHNRPIGEWGKMASRTNPRFKEMEEAITTSSHQLELAEGAIVVEPGTPLPGTLVQEVQDPHDARQKYFDEFYESIGEAGKRGYIGGSVRVVVVGHTHQAAMALYRPPDQRPLLMVDAGAWIEGCTYPLAEGGVAKEPSAQLAVIHGNDARLYQISCNEGA